MKYLITFFNLFTAKLGKTQIKPWYTNVKWLFYCQIELTSYESGVMGLLDGRLRHLLSPRVFTLPMVRAIGKTMVQGKNFGPEITVKRLSTRWVELDMFNSLPSQHGMKNPLTWYSRQLISFDGLVILMWITSLHIFKLLHCPSYQSICFKTEELITNFEQQAS